jgi:hypothetical protein
MERSLLWASLVVGVVVFLCRFLPSLLGRGERTATQAPVAAPPPELHPLLRNVALATPFVGLLATLPTHGAFFAAGQRLGIGFLIGGMGALIAALPLLRSKRDAAGPTVGLAAAYGLVAAATALALLFLRASLMDALMGVAIGWFCVTFALFMGLPSAERDGAAGRQLAAGTGMATTLAAAAMLGTFRDPLTSELAKGTWAAVLLAFTAFGALLAAGAALVPAKGVYGRLLPLALLVGGGGLALFQIATKVTGEPRLWWCGVGGLLVWPVALVLLRDAARWPGRRAGSGFAVPLLAVLVVASGFMAALQTLQGVGAAIFTLALWLVLPVSFALMAPGDDDGEAVVPVALASVALLLFATLLLLYRLFVTRWSDDLRGVNLTDQYALFGLIVGAALPSLLAAVPERWRGGAEAKSGAGLLALVCCTLLTLAAPGVMLILFGPKSAVALLIGLALGSVQSLTGRASLLPSLLALGVALALDQFTGRALPEDEPTRVQKVRWLVFIIAGIAAAVIAANRFGSAHEEGEEAKP